MNKIKFPVISSSILFLLFCASTSYSQQDDSLLLKKIEAIDVSLSSLDESEEDLYMNPVSFQTFYDDLADDGEWIVITKEEIEKELNDGEGQSYASYYQDEDGLVYIWKPSVDDEKWKPYSNGRWVYTTDGWMWVSNYNWGWACYHYGRWWKSQLYGWVWMPGYVWAPSWVMWRVSENHIGWCPLNPKAKWKGEEGVSTSTYNYQTPGDQWVFVEKSKFIDDVKKSNIVAAKENSALVKNSESVLDMKFENGRIYSRGPDVKEIETRTGKAIVPRELKLRKTKGKTLVGANEVSVYRESFKKHYVDVKTGKELKIDKPKKFKKSPKAKKIFKRIKILKKYPPKKRM